MSKFVHANLDQNDQRNWVNTLWCMDVNDSVVIDKARKNYASKVIIRENARAKQEKSKMRWNMLPSVDGGIVARVS